MVATLNFTLCETAEAAVHYVGLAPVLRSSGTSVRGRAQIGHSGHTRARTQLYVATRASACFNPIIKAYYERMRAAGKPSDPLLAAPTLERGMHIAYAVVTHKQTFDPNYQGVPKGEVASA